MGWIRVAAVFGFLAVAMGAIGAHALRERLSPEMLRAFQTGADYHLAHAIALLAIALYGHDRGARITWPAAAISAGVVLFSGSLYAMALTGVTKLGAITPVGGLCLLAGWLSLLFVRAP